MLRPLLDYLGMGPFEDPGHRPALDPCHPDSVVSQTPGRSIEACRPKAVLVDEVDNLALVEAVSID